MYFSIKVFAQTIFDFNLIFQPKQIQEIKDFLLTARRKDAKCKQSCVSIIIFCVKACRLFASIFGMYKNSKLNNFNFKMGTLHGSAFRPHKIYFKIFILICRKNGAGGWILFFIYSKDLFHVLQITIAFFFHFKC